MFFLNGVGNWNAIFFSIFTIQNRNGQKPDDSQIRDFWNNWWDQKLKTPDGEGAWSAQVRFL